MVLCYSLHFTDSEPAARPARREVDHCGWLFLSFDARCSFRCEFGEISPVPPRYYSRRQQEFVKSQVVEVLEVERITPRLQLIASGDLSKPDRRAAEEEGRADKGEKAVGVAAAVSEVRDFVEDSEEEKLKRILRQVNERARQEGVSAGKTENSEQDAGRGGRRRRSTFFNLYNFVKP